MDTVQRLAALLPEKTSAALLRLGGSIREVRIRAGRPVQLVSGEGETLCGEPVSAQTFAGILSALLDYSLHAREPELAQGFFTLSDGSRAGVCGRMAGSNGAIRMTDAGSLCIRIARDVPGCADPIMPIIACNGAVHSLLVVSPPGMGKTTILRDVARQLSLRGYSVAVADERRELAACCRGVPTIDVGPRTDVMDGCAKHIAIGLLLRGMAPEVIVTDEIGDPRDVGAIADAARCGVAIVASAHGFDLDDLWQRRGLGRIISSGVFERAAVLRSPPGTIAKICCFAGMKGGRPVWESA